MKKVYRKRIELRITQDMFDGLMVCKKQHDATLSEILREFITHGLEHYIKPDKE